MSFLVKLTPSARVTASFIALSVAMPISAQALMPPTSHATMALAAALADLKIEVKVEGLDNTDLRQEVRDLSEVVRRPTSFTSTATLKRAAVADATRMQNALSSKGYYAATVTPRVLRTGLDVSVIFAIDRGERFKISEYVIDYDPQTGTKRPETFSELNAQTSGDPSGARLQELQDKLLRYLWDNGHPSAEATGRYVRANFDQGTAVAVFPIQTGPLARYGEIRVNGAGVTDETFIRKLFTPEQGDQYSRRQVDTYRNALAETALFREISIEPAPTEPDGITDLIVTVEERKHRTFGGGLTFGTDVGVGASAYWENRNLLGAGETIRTELNYAAPRQAFEAVITKPLPRLPGSIKGGLLLENEDTDAFTAQSATVSGGISKLALDRNLELSAGLTAKYSNITDLDGTEETFFTASIPLSARFNNEDNNLNPTSGWRASAQVTPFFGDLQFNQVELGGATRYGFGEENRLLIAGRTRFAATFGASGEDLPATERYYAGGGGSVRGYGFQEAGPIDADTGNPTGGASAVEVNLEARYKVTEKIQAAVFVDGGSVYEDEAPSFSGDFLVGAGIGVRYLTPIGPIRLDIATPLDKRTITVADTDDMGAPITRTVFEDDPIHFYIALGQPF